MVVEASEYCLGVAELPWEVLYWFLNATKMKECITL
jgi:hypothetical protein